MSVNVHRAAWAIGLVVLASVALRHSPLFAMAASLAGVLALAWAWTRLSLTGITYRRSLEHSRAFFGDEVELVVDVSNPRFLPVAWLQARDDVPSCLDISGATFEPHHVPRRRLMVNTFGLRWFERIRRKYRVLCRQRGLHRMGPGTLSAGDMFGLFEQTEQLPDRKELVVYPRTLGVVRPRIQAVRPTGAARGDPWLFEDPQRMIGIRPYQPTDSRRRIHWAASARTGSLQVKVYEPSYSAAAAVFLDVATYRLLWEKIDEQSLEFTITVAASLLLDFFEQGLAVGLYTNSSGAGRAPFRIPPGRSVRHIMDELESLAVIGPVAALSIDEVLRRERAGLPYGTTVVAVTSGTVPELGSELARAVSAGHSAALVLTRHQPDAPFTPVPTYLAVEEVLPDGQAVISLR